MNWTQPQYWFLLKCNKVLQWLIHANITTEPKGWHFYILGETRGLKSPVHAGTWGTEKEGADKSSIIVSTTTMRCKSDMNKLCKSVQFSTSKWWIRFFFFTSLIHSGRYAPSRPECTSPCWLIIKQHGLLYRDWQGVPILQYITWGNTHTLLAAREHNKST